MLENKKFTFQNIKQDVTNFKYLTGVSTEQFEILVECVLPYIHCREYADCKHQAAIRKIFFI